MHIQRLSQFVAVVRHGGIGRAARQLGLEQPRLTRNIAALEAELGVCLLHRTPRGASPTAAGTRFLPHALSIIDEARRALAALGPGNDREDKVRLGVSPNLYTRVLPRLTAAFAATEPAYALELSSGTRELMTARLVAGEIDLAACLISEVVYPSPRQEISLDYEVIGAEIVRPYCHAALVRELGDCTLERLSTRPWAIPLEMSVYYRFETAFFRLGLPVPPIRLATPSLALIKETALAGAMLVMLPVSSLLPGQDAELGSLPCADLTMRYNISLMRRRDHGEAHRAAIEAAAHALRLMIGSELPSAA